MGDNAYVKGSDEEYQRAVFDMYPDLLKKIPIWPTYGNHESGSSNSVFESGTYYEIFTLPTNGEAGGLASSTEAYYSFDYANIHFISLNSHDIDRSASGSMATWLKNDLTSTNQDWRIAYWHHPPHSKGTHDSDIEIRLIEMRENILSILEEHGVDLVFSGHSHAYERSFLIDGHYGDSATLSPTMILDNGDGKIDGDGEYIKPSASGAPHEGTVYVVMGSSGMYSLFNKPQHPVMYLAIASLSSLILDFNDRELLLSFLDQNGSVKDYFTLTKENTN